VGAPLPMSAVFDADSIVDAPASPTRPDYPAWLAGSRETPGRRTKRSQRFPCEMADVRIRDITRRYPRPAKSAGGCKMYDCRRFEARASPDPDALSRNDTHLVGTLAIPSMNRK
jgi:hypothetical protein